MQLKNNQYTALPLLDKFSLYTKQNKNGCIEWLAGKTTDGYGIININGKSLLAHRVAFELQNNVIPNNMCICHSCDNPSCVNTQHLFMATHAENMRDMKNKGRRKNVNTKEKNGKAKITQIIADQIRVFRTQGNSYKALSIKYNVSITTIGRICNKENWI